MVLGRDAIGRRVRGLMEIFQRRWRCTKSNNTSGILQSAAAAAASEEVKIIILIYMMTKTDDHSSLLQSMRVWDDENVQ